MTSIAGDQRVGSAFQAALPQWFRRRLTDWMPPVRNPRFWATQMLVVLIAAVHDGIELFGLLPWFGQAYFLPVSMFFIPVVYSALYFGRSGAVATALWCTVITIPNWLFVHDGGRAFGSFSQMMIINGLAFFVGSRVDQQMKARADAEAASQALQVSEEKYRGLFETSSEGVLVLTPTGDIIEANPAAARLLKTPIEQLRGAQVRSVIPGGDERKLPASNHRPQPFSVVGPQGDNVWLEPVTTVLSETDGIMQLMLRDITEQVRRQLGLETYAAEVVRAQEEERKRLAQELHDDTVQSLVLLWRQLNEAAGKASEASRVQSMYEARDFAGKIAESVRGYAQGLRPPVLDDLGLTPALRKLTEEMAERMGAPVELRVSGATHRLTPDVELALFRIAQESLRNTERHAHASNVFVALQYGQDCTSLSIRDDGQGFRFSSREKLAGTSKLGLLGIHERARICGGKVTIRTRPGSGTTVMAKIPRYSSAQPQN